MSPDGGPGGVNMAGMNPSRSTSRYTWAISRNLSASRLENRAMRSTVVSRSREHTRARPSGKTWANWFSGQT